MSDTDTTPDNADPEMPPPSRVRVIVAGSLWVVYTFLVLAVTLRPTPVTEGAGKDVVKTVLSVGHGVGLSDSFNFATLQFLANVGMFIPFGFLLALALPATRAWIGILGSAVLSGLVEGAQQLFLAARSADVWDVVANTLGGALGVAAAIVLRALVHRRDQRMLERAGYRDRLAARGELEGS